MTEENALARYKRLAGHDVPSYNDPATPPKEPEPERDTFLGMPLRTPEERGVKLKQTLDVIKNTAGGLNKGLVDMADIPASVLNLGLKTAGVGPRAGGMRSLPVVGEFLTQATQRAVPKGQNLIADAAFTAGEWGGLDKSGLVIGPAAAMGEYLGGAKGEIAGGMTALAAMLRGQFKAGAPPEIKDELRPDPSIPHKERDAVNFVAANVRDKSQAMRNIREGVKKGEVGSTADLARDPALFGVEQGLDNLGAGSDRLATLAKDRDIQTLEQVRAPFGQVETAPNQTASEVAGEGAKVRVGQIDEQLADRGLREEDRVFTQLDRQKNINEAQEVVRLKQAIAARDVERGQQIGLSQARERQAAQDIPERQEALNKAQLEVEPAGRPYQTSEQLATDYTTYEKKLKTELQAEGWKQWDSGPHVNVEGMYPEIVEHIEGIVPDTDKVARVLGRTETLKAFKGKKGPQHPKVLSETLSDIKKAIESPDVDKADTRILTLFKMAFEEQMKLRGSAGAYDKGVAASKKMHELLGGKLIADARRKNSPAALGQALLTKGDKGADAARAMLEANRQGEDFANPKILGNMEEYILAKAQEGPKNIDDTFLEDHSAMLAVWGDERPKFTAKLNTVLEQQQALEATSQRAAKVAEDEGKFREVTSKQASEDIQTTLPLAKEKRVTERKTILRKAADAAVKDIEKRYSGLQKSNEKSILAKFADKPSIVIKDLLKREDGRRSWNSLRTRMMKDQPEAFKAAIGDEVTKMMTTYSDIGTKEASASALKELQSVRSRLEDVLNPKELTALTDAAQRTITKTMKRKAGQGMSYRQATSEVTNLMASGGAVAALQGLGGTNSLMLMGTVKRFLLKELRGKLDPAKVRLVERIMTDPQTFLDKMQALDLQNTEDLTKMLEELAAGTKHTEGKARKRATGALGQLIATDEDEGL